MKTTVIGFKKSSRNLLFFFVLLSALLISLLARAEEVTLAWNANTETDLAGYKIHYGTSSCTYTTSLDVHNVTTYTVTGLSAGQTYFFAASAYNASGLQSGHSNEVSHTIPATNAAPSTPSPPSGPSSAMVNTALAFTTTATDPNGHVLAYRYDWGDGVESNWGGPGQSHSWSTAGQYNVKAQARDSLGALSEWSAAAVIAITSPDPVVVDSDGDGVPDSRDAFPNDPKEWADENGNGIGDNADAAAANNKQVPEAPVLTSPVYDDLVSFVTTLKTDPFLPAVTGAAHAKTRWQVFRDEDDACLLDILSSTALTHLKVPKLVLDEGTKYFWRARFIDSNGSVSDWSDYGYFVTSETGSDLNANGIPDVQEVSTSADLDKDGVRDNQQTTIKSVRMEGTTVQIGVSIKNCPTALAVESVESEDPAQQDAYASSKPRRMPFGLINFRIAVAKPGDQGTVKLYFSEPAPAKSRWYKYDPPADQWADFSAYAKFATDRRSLTLNLRDGGAGDADGVANGVIVDPAGIVEEDDDETGDSDGSTSGGGGCFITAAQPKATLGEPASGGWLLLGLMGVVGKALFQRQNRAGC
jgi:chitinase